MIIHPSPPTPWDVYTSLRHSILVDFQSLLPSLEVANLSPRPGEYSQVGLLLDLSKLPPGWQFWSLRVRHYVNLFCVSSKTFHFGVMLGWRAPLPNREESQVKAKLREGIHSSPYFPRDLMSPRPCSHPRAPPCSPLKLPSSGWGCVPSDGSSF